jgi:cold shock CspA family protein
MNHKAARLLAEKVTRELYRIAQAYGKEHPFGFDDLVHDLSVMLERNCLQSVSLKFHRANARRDVLAEYNYDLHAGQPRFHLDDAQGLGIVPLSPPFGMGLVVRRDQQAGAYEGLLRLRWSDAPDYARNGGFEHRDGNTTRRTGGRASKRIYMDETLRCRGQVKFYLPAKQYGFIVGPDGTDIFFHFNNVQGFQPRQGQRVSYLPLATPRGVQAKDVRLA